MDSTKAPAPDLAQEFERLSDAATPGPWSIFASGLHGPAYLRIMRPPGAEDDNPPALRGLDIGGLYLSRNAHFIAFCGSHRTEIAQALRAWKIASQPTDEQLNAVVAGFQDRPNIRTTSVNDYGRESARGALAAIVAAVQEKPE
jgi:hypothetical protein